MNNDSGLSRDPDAASASFRALSLEVSLTVKDLPKSLAWYRNVMGFSEDQRHERDGKLMAVSLKAGNVRILIGQDDGARGWERVKGEGFSVQFTTDQNIDELAARIQSQGGVLATEPIDMPWGARVFRVQDPDGFRIAVSSPRA
ncbi:MAG: VOC family protein [Acidobacteriota bacterium]